MADDKLEILISAKNSSALKALGDVDHELKKLGGDAKATAAGINVAANRIDALKRSQSAAAGTAAELAASQKEAVAAATQLGGKVGWVNQQLVGLKAGVGHARALTSELHSVADAAIRAGARTTAAGLFGAGVAIKGGLTAFAEREQQIAALKAMSSSAEEAERKLAELKDLAQRPGLELPALIKGQVALAGVDMSAERANRTMKAFANATVLSGGGIEEMERSLKGFRDIMSKGTVSAEDLKGQLIENMPIASKVLKETFGTQNAEKIQALGLSMDEFGDRFVAGLEKLPEVSGGLANDLNNLKQAWLETKIAFGEGLLGKDGAENLKRFSDALGGSQDSARKAGEGMAKLLEAGLKLATFAADHADQIVLLAKAYLFVFGPLRLVTGIGLKGVALWKDTATVLKIVPAAGQAAAAGFGALKTAIAGVTVAGAGMGLAVGAAATGAYLLWKRNLDVIRETQDELKRAEQGAKDYNGQLDDMVKRGMMSEADAARNAAPGPRSGWDKYLGSLTAGLIETPWQRRKREWEESAVTGMGRAKAGMSVRDEQAAAAARERSAKSAADDAEAALKRSKEAETIEERRLKIAEARVALAKAEGASAVELAGLEKQLAGQHEKVWSAKLAAAAAEGDTAKLLQTQLEIEAEKLGLRAKAAEDLRRAEKERADEAKKAADEQRKAAEEEAKVEREKAERSLSLREAELDHARAKLDYAKATGGAAADILKLERDVAAVLEDAYRQRLGIAELQARQEKTATAQAREQLNIATERLRRETEIAEQKLRAHKDAYDFAIREAELRADIAREQAAGLAAQGGDARGAAAQAQAWADWANRLKLGRAGLEGPGEAHLERLSQWREATADWSRRQEDAARERERAARETEQVKSGGGRAGAGADVVSLAGRQVDKGPDRLMSAIFGGDPGRVSDILQEARRATGTYGAADPYEALRRPDTRGLDSALLRALETRDRVLIETIVDAIAGRR